MHAPERNPEQADVGEEYQPQAARTDEESGDERGARYGEPSTDTDADGGLGQNPSTEP